MAVRVCKMGRCQCTVLIRGWAGVLTVVAVKSGLELLDNRASLGLGRGGGNQAGDGGEQDKRVLHYERKKW